MPVYCWRCPAKNCGRRAVGRLGGAGRGDLIFTLCTWAILPRARVLLPRLRGGHLVAAHLRVRGGCRERRPAFARCVPHTLLRGKTNSAYARSRHGCSAASSPAVGGG